MGGCAEESSSLCLIAPQSGISALTLCYLKSHAPALSFFKLDLAVLLFLAFRMFENHLVASPPSPVRGTPGAITLAVDQLGNADVFYHRGFQPTNVGGGDPPFSFVSLNFSQL